MRFRTEVKIKKSNIEINHQSKVMMLGSCFTGNIGQKLIDDKFDVTLNPMGILYNPCSIRTALNFLLNPAILKEEDIFYSNGLYHSFYHHGDFSGSNKLEMLNRINNSLQSAQHSFEQTNVLFITFGTAYVFEHIENKEIVSNCHKLPASAFRRFRLPVEDIIVSWTDVLHELESRKPNLQLVFTVSPIRHLSDGAADNQMSKSTLIYAANTLANGFKNVHYFPAYEIMMDELRDYRFYNEDMIHPSPVAVNYIRQRFSETYMNEDTMKIAEEWKNIQLAIDHRPFNQFGEEYKSFLRQTLLKLKAFNRKYPYICCDNQIASIEQKLEDR